MLAQLGLRGGREDRFLETRGLSQALGQLNTAHRARLSILRQAGSRQVAAHDALDGDHEQAAAHDRTPVDLGRNLEARGLGTLQGARGLGRGLRADGQQVVLHERTQLAHPPDGKLIEDRALARDLRGQHVVVGADAIRGHHEERLRTRLRMAGTALGGRRFLRGADHGLVGSVDIANLPRVQGGPTVQGSGHNAPQCRVIS